MISDHMTCALAAQLLDWFENGDYAAPWSLWKALSHMRTCEDPECPTTLYDELDNPLLAACLELAVIARAWQDIVWQCKSLFRDEEGGAESINADVEPIIARNWIKETRRLMQARNVATEQRSELRGQLKRLGAILKNHCPLPIQPEDLGFSFLCELVPIEDAAIEDPTKVLHDACLRLQIPSPFTFTSPES